LTQFQKQITTETMDFHQEPLFQWISQFAYQPQIVYIAIVGLMVASAFGFPMPEEITIISVGLLAYMGTHPDLFPPPFVGAPVVSAVEAAAVIFFAVVIADYIVFGIGRVFGRKLMRYPKTAWLFPEKSMEKINEWLRRFGDRAVFLFRFTPGLRFPAHVLLGMSHYSGRRFLTVDGFAALISIPTQLLLVAHMGESILKVLFQFKQGLLVVIVVVFGCWLTLKLWRRLKPRPVPEKYPFP
jgi:membrane protein DedA with SNARE-associated domain